MSKLMFISENATYDLHNSIMKEYEHLGHIINPKAHARHHIDTGNWAYNIGTLFINYRSYWETPISPLILRTQGYVHDISKAREGNPFHEVGTAYLVLTEGEKLGLVAGGLQTERRDALKQMAHIILPDFVLYEALGGNNYPNTEFYLDKIENFKDRINYLRMELSDDNIPLSIEDLAIPQTWMQLIGQYADLTNGKPGTYENRLSDILHRYGNKESPYCDPMYYRIVDKALPRVRLGLSLIDRIIYNFLSPQKENILHT